MDNPGQSLFVGGSLHLDGIAALDEDEEEDLRRQEEEEENKRREKELQDMLINAFDDLEDEESYINPSGHLSLSLAPGGGSGGGRDGVSGLEGIRLNHLHPEGSIESRQDYQDLHNGLTQYNYQDSRLNGSQGGRGSLESLSPTNSVTPWSEESQEGVSGRLSPLQGHNTSGENLDEGGRSSGTHHGDYEGDHDQGYHNEPSGITSGPYHGDNYQTRNIGVQENQETLSDQYMGAETSYAQLKVLYEARGRELDRQMSDIKKLQYEKSHDVRLLQHQLNLQKSENEGRAASITQLQILLSEKEERTKLLLTDMKELQNKLTTTQDENKKLNFELETAESTISSLECQLSELKAVDSLSRNQKLHEDFIRKLKQGSQEDKDLLMRKLQESQKEVQTSQQEVKKLKEELKTTRNMYDGAVVQKTEMVAKLNLTIETLRKQYEELLQAHDSQEILKLELRVKSLETQNKSLEEKASMLDIELKKAKEDLKGFDTAIKLGIMSDILPVEDSLVGLGIKKTLTYSDSPPKGVDKRGGDADKFSEAQERVKIREELKKSLMINKAKRDEINMLRDDVQEKQAMIKKAHSDLRDAHAEIKELREKLMKLQSEQAQWELQDDSSSLKGTTNNWALQAENASLRQEVACLLASVRDCKMLFENLRDSIASLQTNLSNAYSEDGVISLISKLDQFLNHAGSGEKFSEETEHFHEVLAELRKENSALHRSQELWEKRMCGIETKLKVSEKIMLTAITSPGRADEIVHSCIVLQKLLSDLGEMVKAMKGEHSEAHEEKLTLQGKLTSSELETEKMKDEIVRLKVEKDELQAEMTNLSKEKDEERGTALAACHNTYLKFHEEAMHELEVRVKAEYEDIAADLKREILRLTDELNETKECYIQVCQEKDQLEAKLQESRKSKLSAQESQTAAHGSKALTSTPDSGITTDSVLHQGQSQERVLNQKNDCLGADFNPAEEKYRQDSENLQIQNKASLSTHKHLDELVTERQRANMTIEELQEKCRVLMESNEELKDECKRKEGEILKLRGAAVCETVTSEDGWQSVLERQQKRQEDEKEELKMHYLNMIEELKAKYVEGSNLLEMKVKEQDSHMNLLDGRVKEQEDIIRAVTGELRKANARAQAKEEEGEQEVKRLTDMVQNLEAELQEKQEQNNNTRVSFQKYIQKLESEQKHISQKMHKAEVELKEKEAKYISIKLKFKKYKELISQNEYYKAELTRLTDEYKIIKETLLERVRSYLEEVKGKCVAGIDSVIVVLQGCDSVQLTLAGTLQALEQLSENLKNFKLQLL